MLKHGDHTKQIGSPIVQISGISASVYRTHITARRASRKGHPRPLFAFHTLLYVGSLNAAVNILLRALIIAVYLQSHANEGHMKAARTLVKRYFGRLRPIKPMESAKHEGVSGLDAKATEAHMADPPPLSNRKRVQQMYPNIQRRVQRKHAEHQEMWNQMTEEEKEEHKEKHRRAREESEKRLQKALVEGVNVCVDLHFDDEHSEKERKSMWKQLSLTYCALKKASNPVHLHVTSIVPDSQTENGLKSQGLDSWLVSKHHRSPVDIFTRENVVVLSPDSQNVLKEVSKDKVYVIGGIVDRSVRKGRTKDFAVEESVECARLPVQEYIPNRQSHILNIDQMVSILCTYLETQDWLLTLQQHVPIRRVMSKAERKQLKLPRKDDIDDITEDDTVTTSGDTREIQVDCKTESPSKDASDNEAGSSSSRYMLEKT